MTLFHILILSLIQGITEFLPVSSSGHLILLPYFFNWKEQGLEIDVAMHLGTLSAVLIYFWQDILQMIRGGWAYTFSGFKRNYYTAYTQLAFTLVIATLPAIIVGFLIKKFFPHDLRHNTIIAVMSIIFGLLLYCADRWSQNQYKLSDITIKRGFLIGIAQAIALVPGVSRSGVCLTMARLLGFNRIDAIRFTFLLSIPSVIGAATLTTHDMIKNGATISLSDLGLVIISSMAVGLAAIHFMMWFLARFSFAPFAIYRMILGIIILLWL